MIPPSAVDPSTMNPEEKKMLCRLIGDALEYGQVTDRDAWSKVLSELGCGMPVGAMKQAELPLGETEY